MFGAPQEDIVSIPFSVKGNVSLYHFGVFFFFKFIFSILIIILVHPSGVLPESIPFELDLTRGSLDDNNQHYLEPMGKLQWAGAHASFVSSTTNEMKVSDNFIRSFGHNKLVSGEPVENIELALPASAPVIPKGSIIREVDVPRMDQNQLDAEALAAETEIY